MVHIMSN